MSRPFALECWRCEQPITDPSQAMEDVTGDTVCLDCHIAKREEYGEAFDELAGHPLEAVGELTRGWRQ